MLDINPWYTVYQGLSLEAELNPGEDEEDGNDGGEGSEGPEGWIATSSTSKKVYFLCQKPALARPSSRESQSRGFWAKPGRNITSCMLLPKKIKFTLDYNLVANYIFVQFHMAEQDCMTLPTLPTLSNMHCVPCFRWLQRPLKFPDLTISHLNSRFDLNGKPMPNYYVFT